jgi:hypothetical protein
VLRAVKHSVRVGRKVKLRGKVRGAFRAGARVRLMVRSGGRWHALRRKPVDANGTFGTNARLARKAGASRLALKKVRLRHRVRVLRIRAVVKGVGRSNVVRVRVRR